MGGDGISVKVAVHQAQYLPWLGYFDKIARCDAFVFLDNVQYKKREYQNRNRIRTAGGPVWLTVPVVTKGGFFQKISDVVIDNTANWQRKHVKSMEGSYAGCAFYDEYAVKLERFYGERWERLGELNMEMARFFMEELGIGTRVFVESELGTGGVSTGRIVEICHALGATVYVSGAGGAEYMDESMFEANGIGLEYQRYVHPEYRQRYEGFEPYMSIVDLLMNCGGVKGREILSSGSEEVR